jgi:hypothetical protein
MEMTTDADRIMVFLLLAEVHVQFNHFPEATKTIQEAMNEFSGYPEEVKYTISDFPSHHKGSKREREREREGEGERGKVQELG